MVKRLHLTHPGKDNDCSMLRLYLMVLNSQTAIHLLAKKTEEG